ncbi:proteasome activator pa28 REG alpha/beta subunit [Hysterangium stoloniferum]|nr:proteasome activator pa28 REG alpha/beta subunit [Hysterangium stoloniferum]
MDDELSSKLDGINKKITATAEEIVFRTLPQKSINEESSPFNRSFLYTTTDPTVYAPPSMEEPETKKRKRSDDKVDKSRSDTSNARLPNLVVSNKHRPHFHDYAYQAQARVKTECEELIELCDNVKLWVSLTMPRGDNFGVQVQEEVLSELHRSQESGYNLRDHARTNYLQRARICSKLIKYPNIEDYSLALTEHDAKQLYMARQHIVDIKNIYAILTDVLHKNIEKVTSHSTRCWITP